MRRRLNNILKLGAQLLLLPMALHAGDPVGLCFHLQILRQIILLVGIIDIMHMLFEVTDCFRFGPLTILAQLLN